MFTNNKIIKGFIVLEGIDGSGTSTQQKKLAEKLQQNNIPFHSTSEPTDSSIGILIRSILSSDTNVDRSTLARLFAADRNEHLYGHGGIVEESRDKAVICDRYLFSSLAYQGSDIGLERVWDMNKDFPLPEFLFFFDIDPHAAKKRYTTRKKLDIYENIGFHEQVVQNYNRVFADLQKHNLPNLRFYRIDASQNVEDVFVEFWRILSTHPIVNS